MKIETTYVAAALLIDVKAPREPAAVQATEEDASVQGERVMSYDDLLPYLWLPIAGAY